MIRPDDDRRYVLKRLKNSDRPSRFETEIEATRSLYDEFPWAFPEIVDFGFDEKDRLFYVMPWFPGSLQTEADDKRYMADGPSGIARLIELVDRLALLHSKDWAHRDLKPANVLVNTDHELVLADLGLAIQVLEHDDTARDTPSWEAIGSRYYIAPENEDGKFEGTEHRSCDFYAFGKIMWVLLAGRRPLSRETQLEAENRLSHVLGAQFAPIDELGAHLLRTDPLARLTRWGVVRDELSVVASTLRGDDLSRSSPPGHPVDAPEAVAQAARTFRDSLRATTITAQQQRTQSRTQSYHELPEIAFASGQEFGDRIPDLNAESGGHFQVNPGASSQPTFGELLPALQTSWPQPALEANLDPLCLMRGCAIRLGVDSLFASPPPSMFAAGFVLLAEDEVWMLRVPMLLEQVVGGRAMIFPPLLGRFAAIEGPLRLGLSAARDAAKRLGDNVCQDGSRLAAEYIEHVRNDRNVRARDTWTTGPG